MSSHLSIPSLHQMVTLRTHISANNCTPPSLPLVQLPTTDPSSPGINAHDYTPPSLPTMDPFNYEWQITYVIVGNMIQTFAKNMIAHFIPADGTRRTETVRSYLLSEFEVRFSLIAIALFYSYQCVVSRLDMYRTKVLLYRTMVLLVRPTKVRR